MNIPPETSQMYKILYKLEICTILKLFSQHYVLNIFPFIQHSIMLITYYQALLYIFNILGTLKFDTLSIYTNMYSLTFHKNHSCYYYFNKTVAQET